MKARERPLGERIKLVEELWDSIATGQALPLTAAQRTELDRGLDAYVVDMRAGRPRARGLVRHSSKVMTFEARLRPETKRHFT